MVNDAEQLAQSVRLNFPCVASLPKWLAVTKPSNYLTDLNFVLSFANVDLYNITLSNAETKRVTFQTC